MTASESLCSHCSIIPSTKISCCPGYIDFSSYCGLNATLKKSCISRCGHGHPLSAGHEGHAQEMLPVVEQTPDSVRGGRSGLRGHHGPEYLSPAAASAPSRITFDSAPELESDLEKKGKTELLNMVRGILPQGSTASISGNRRLWGWQAMRPLHRRARSKTSPSWWCRPTSLIDADTPVLRQPGEHRHQVRRQRARRAGCATRGNQKYGIVAARKVDERTERVTHIVEKPET